MIRLNQEEIKHFAKSLNFTESQAKDITDLFYQWCSEGKNSEKYLNTVDNYIKQWELDWHREDNWLEFYKYEKENNYYEYDKPEETFEDMCTFKQCMLNEFAFELPNNDMIIVSY